MRAPLQLRHATRPLASAALLLVALLLSACGLLPERPNYPQAPIRADAPTRNVANGPSAPCAKIYWQNLGATRDINKAIIDGNGDGSLISTGYGPRPAPTKPRADADWVGAQELEADSLRRSERSVELSVQFPGEQQKAQLQAIERWLQQHVVVEINRCPR